MAKYSGKIFRVANKFLKIKKSGTHYVSVGKYNPKTKSFTCNIITSLENTVQVPKKYRQAYLQNNAYHKEDEGTFLVFKKTKYNELRTGKLTPIPVDDFKGATVWSAFSETKEVKLEDMRKSQHQPHMKIKTKK